MFKRKNKKKERVSPKKLSGLTFRNEGSGTCIIDSRNITQPRTVGLILKRPFSTYYMFCPFVQRGLYFDLKPPANFRTPAKAQAWLEKHAVAWNEKRIYTPFNRFARHILSDKLSKFPLTSTYFQLCFTQLLLAVLFICYQSEDPVPNIATKVGAVFFLANGILNLIAFLQENL